MVTSLILIPAFILNACLPAIRTHSYAVGAALWVFLFIQTASSWPSFLKESIQPKDIETATGPFAKDHLYVDKTHLAQKLCEGGGSYFFVCPRRFGKSTFLQTVQGIFDGRGRQIFNYTDIHQSNYSWDSYLVLYLDLGGAVIETDETCKKLMKIPGSLTLLQQEVHKTFTKFKTMHDLSKPKETLFPAEFHSILEEIKENGNLTVVLIDEYDFAILNNVIICPKAERINADLVRDIFLQLKKFSGLMQFAFLIGISKSVVSTLLNSFDLVDITDDVDLHDIAGLTEADLGKHYSDHLAEASRISGKSEDIMTSELKKWYNGYKFSQFAPPLYNPLSVHSYLRKGEAKVYWVDRATANFLFQQMVNRPEEFSVQNMADGVESELKGLQSLNETDPALLLYDVGYLTIKSFSDGYYTLWFSNVEMEGAFYKDIADAAKASGGIGVDIEKIRKALMNPIPKFKAFISALNSGIKKFVTRGPFEEWFDWQIMLFIKYAGIQVKRQCNIAIVPNLSNGYKKCKVVDVTGYNKDTFFLIEVKFERTGCSEAWDDVKQSLQAHLDRNEKEEKPLNILAAGITFTADRRKNPVLSYKAKLFASNGTVLEWHFSSTRIKHDPESDEFFVESTKQ